jgi:fructosamine-3-kinase
MSGGAVADALASCLRQQLAIDLATLQPVGGGCSHRAWWLQGRGGEQIFAKTNRPEQLPLLEAEAEGLAALAAAAEPPGLQIPTALHCGISGGQAVLLLPWLELRTGPSQEPRSWAALGAQLAQLHRRSLSAAQHGYGWPQDNFIGAGPQANGWHAEWGSFFAERRLGSQLAWAERQGRTLPDAQELLAQVPLWLRSHRCDPVLVHGDLWAGNASLLQGGGATLFDPAVYRGDREVDLAMAQLFGGFPAAFFKGYSEQWPLEPGHEQRLELYNLYHLLNHANLFGGGYWEQAQRSIQALLRRFN